ncbi:Glyoxalase/Bleomycin resistance protein/Dihydroxybiphenyl dioxygenase [Dendryphion nanum]|uniref:Glyoxalase/Bleomycin resistance protein/Dihydroxybiphenyl dioxygenase n=1 Tax=Dendryphion nanum TaxID=256645 RepID=A0A9P9EKW9_9PLEO|nr:Glyoxalase/Bleomycin resistance protein/Dihydroxybiphenyl dioxygenase [Dendryphion nanum]
MGSSTTLNPVLLFNFDQLPHIAAFLLASTLSIPRKQIGDIPSALCPIAPSLPRRTPHSREQHPSIESQADEARTPAEHEPDSLVNIYSKNTHAVPQFYNFVQLHSVTMPPTTHNHVFNHVAISVADCDAAVEWYGRVFGFKRLRGDRMTERTEMPDAPIFKIYDSKLHKVKVAWLGTGNSVGFEVFQFIDPGHEPKREFEYTRAGFFHIAVTTPDVDAMCKTVIENGGEQVGETVSMGGQERAAYVTDPWGNVVELLSCSFEALMANK